jgi:phage tail P2-like protein
VRDIQSITLRELLPPSIADDPDIVASAESIDAELRTTTGYIPDVAIIKRLRNREIDNPLLLDILAWGLHVDFYDPDLPIEVKQELVANSLDWHTRKGTPSVVEEIVTEVIADAEVSEWFEYGGKPYTFKVGTESEDVSVQALQKLLDAIFSVKNTRSWLEAIEILRRGESEIFVGAGIVQNIRTTVPPDYDIGYGELSFGGLSYGGRPSEGGI